LHPARGAPAPGKEAEDPQGTWWPLPCGELAELSRVLLTLDMQYLQGKLPGAFPTAVTSLALKTVQRRSGRSGTEEGFCQKCHSVSSPGC